MRPAKWRVPCAVWQEQDEEYDDEEEEYDEEEDDDDWPEAADECNDSDGDVDCNDGGGSGGDDSGGGGGAGSSSDGRGHKQRVGVGACFRRFIYAIRSQDGTVPRVPGGKALGKAAKRKRSTVQTAAAARAGQAFYGIAEVGSTRCRAPLAPPFFWDADKERAWNPEAKPAERRGYFVWNGDIAHDVYF